MEKFVESLLGKVRMRRSNELLVVGKGGKKAPIHCGAATSALEKETLILWRPVLYVACGY